VPELPEVEAVRRALLPVMQGARFDRVVAWRPDLRFALPDRFVQRLEGAAVERLRRRGKYLLAELTSGEVLVMHLGMSGSFRVDVGEAGTTPGAFRYDRGAPAAHDHVVFVMSSGATVTFNDPRRFGSMDLVRGDALAAHGSVGTLGREPLDDEFDAAALAAACRGRKTPLKVALLDQRIVAGVGNIYACEALHRARLSPRRRASTIATRTGAPRETAGRLAQAIKHVLQQAVNRSARYQDRTGATSDTAYFPNRFRVYDREGERCLRRGCSGVVRRIVQAGRSTFFCPVCQK
jgi:formamidopyrimidine-DNA glycosylase